ncbi:flagellar filament capping protein FliD [Brevibacillus panacihumi]|uniref:Flagellar hook-associated protein 2 C-terminal domain-containing protein n=1 Tax=Brevibacillus panacihumi TaxID=497735 RepID=A0A3M8CPP2_9BACL|nr:flagellar filament capping protein FliD [Brevibacillus panacihumi]RNB77746.1 hypothetical protein EDM58_13805 [Brevibacillus panacihumi]
MRFTRVTHTPFSHRVGRYHFQMAQAKLNTPVQPVFTYSLQPFYARQQEWVTELSHSLSRLYRFSAELDQSAREFDPDRKISAINGRIATSSHPEAVTAEALPGAEPANCELTVYSLASSQANRSLGALPGEPSPVRPGHHTFTLSIDEQEKELTFYSDPAYSFADSLRRMAGVINRSKLGVSARVEASGEHSPWSLVMESIRPGAKQAFTLRDTSGHCIRALRLDQTETAARDAELLLNHQHVQLEQNQLSVDNRGVRLTLLQADRSQPIHIAVVKDTERLLEQTKTLVHRYNRLLAFLREHQDVLSTQKLETFTRISRAADQELLPFGIKRSDNGELQLDESHWRRAVDADFTAFAEAMKGLGRQFREETMKIQATPLGSFSHSYTESQSANPYASRSWSSFQYNYATAAGMFIDMRW